MARGAHRAIEGQVENASAIRQSTESPRPDVPPTSSAALGLGGSRQTAGGLRRFSHEAMHTVFEVYTVHPDERYAAQAAQAAFDLTDRLERELSRFLTNSDITRVNHLAAGDSTRVSPSTLECLVIARHMYDLTGGAFDISIGTGLPALELEADECVVRTTKDDVRVDLGGIGKGYAVDLMAELLEEWGLAARARPRRLQLGPRARVARRPRRLAPHPEQSGRSLPGARPPFGSTNRARRLRRAQGRPHRRSADRRTRPRALRGLGGSAPAAGSGRPGVCRWPEDGGGRCHRCPDDRVHAAEHRRDRGHLPGQSRARGLGAAGVRHRSHRGGGPSSLRRSRTTGRDPVTSGPVAVRDRAGILRRAVRQADAHFC